jgi:D-glycero-beta-D-manno-heptose-7-phosphate kinase
MQIERVREILARAREQRILVAGDLMLDEFLWGEVTRISPEAPVPVVRVVGESSYPGGAANVARNVREFAGWSGVLGVTGDDDAGRRLIASLSASGIDTSGCLLDRRRSTIVKTRIIAKHQQVVRVDRESDSPCDGLVSGHIERAVDDLMPSVGGVIFSDYAKGFLTQATVDRIRRSADRLNKITAVDPSPLNEVSWSGSTVIKPNRAEALRAAGLHELSSGMADDIMLRVGAGLLDRWNTRMILLTLGEEGMLLIERDRPVYHSPTRAREVFDVSGAGDTAIAVFTVALCAGAEASEAAELANAASGIVVGKLGTATVSPAELEAEFDGSRG